MRGRISHEARIVAQLRMEILSGPFRPGEPLREESLAARFDVARGPIREAFRTLLHEGLLVSRPMCGATAAPVPPETVLEVLTPVRRILELDALRRCIATRDEHGFAAWTPLLRDLRAACASNKEGALFDADFTFHEQLFHTAGESGLVAVWRAAVIQLRWFHTQRNRLAAGTDRDLLVIHFTHTKLLECFRTGTNKEAEQALASHMEDGAFNEACRAEYRK